MRRRLIDGAAALALAALSAEILLRRWAWGQVPTQIGAGPVYALLAVDAAAVVWLARRALGRRVRATGGA